MCGIIGVLANRPVAPIMLEALQRLEYRGYDSAGIASVDGGRLDRRRASGKLSELAALLQQQPLAGTIGIGHTRWATHGSPTVANAHPHRSGPVAVVHNGIIENYRELREELSGQGWTFESETDTEVIAALCASMLRRGLNHEDAAGATFGRLRGAFALCLMFEGTDNLMIAARQGSPLVIGFGEDEAFVGSDAIALGPLTNRITYLEDGDWAVLTRTSKRIHDATGAIVERPVQVLSIDSFIADKGNHRHFMAKEIQEQPSVAARLLGACIDRDNGAVRFVGLDTDWRSVPRLTLIGCGTACLAGQVAKTWFEKLAQLPIETDIASEFRYREPPLPQGGVTLVISQSGETADTLAALRYARTSGQHTIAMVNVTTSTIAREAGAVMPTLAGPEIGVASTKAFTAQLMSLFLLAVQIGRQRGVISAERERDLVELMTTVPRLMAETLQAEGDIASVAAELADSRNALFLGRGQMFPMALEGALKLKEVSYIHAEGYAAGELKHGPIALIDEAMPVIALAPNDALSEKMNSNLSEVMARKGRVVVLGQEGDDLVADAWRSIILPACDGLLAPFIYAVAVQLLAYHVANTKGTDVDQPRNLAKSVTVE